MDDLVNYDYVPCPNKIHRLTDPGMIQFFKDMDEHGDFNLSESEQRWAGRYEHLLSHGYKLRPRFHPHWNPSWRETELAPISPMACEDSLEHLSHSIIDAKRVKDGKIVVIKWIPPYTHEGDIGQMLSTPDRLQDTMNHCVPIYDSFADIGDNAGSSYIVMPLLRDFNDPPFAYVDEVVDFVRQTLEGLVYLHGQNVAHRDLSDGNIMMDGRKMYGKKGFHPSDQSKIASDIMVYAKPLTRSDAGNIKYFLTDFGLSTHFVDPSKPRLVIGNRAQDKDIPELSDRIPYDPFAVDIFTLGMVYKRNFLEKYSNVDFLSSLCSSMTQLSPSKRPTAVDTLSIFHRSISECHGIALRWRLRRPRESRIQGILSEFHSAFRELMFKMKLPASLLLSAIRAIALFPFKLIAFVLYLGPRRLITFLRRLFWKPEGLPLLE